MENKLKVYDLTIEHQKKPLGIDCIRPRFSWKLENNSSNVLQTAYQIDVFKDKDLVVSTKKILSDNSIENTISNLKLEPMTRYDWKVTVWDNYDNIAYCESFFETGRLNTPFLGSWIEPEQIPTPSSLKGKAFSREAVASNQYKGIERDFAEFRPAQFIRIPVHVKKAIKKARVYVTAHGVYQLYINGKRPDDRELAPENTTYYKLLQYQTYDITALIKSGKNVFGIILGDGWWTGRVGTTGDSCQYGDKIGLLIEGVFTYLDGTQEIITGEQGVSTTGPIIYSDLFVGERYDARKEIENWSLPNFNDSEWKPVNQVSYKQDNLVGQYGEPIRAVECFHPKEIITTPAGETVIDVGKVIAGYVEFSLISKAGQEIKLEHSEVLDSEGNYYNNILGINKEQTDIYITKDGYQTYKPHFTYHGFRYIRVSGWKGRLSTNDFKIYVLSSDMKIISNFQTSDERINQLQRNILSSQRANTISIPTDCPQREKAGWTGDIMAFAPTMCFNTEADSFLTRWMANVRYDQLENGAIPNVVPYLKAYQLFLKDMTGFETSCGWGDAVITVPYAMYKAYGDRRILEENYEAMIKWMGYIEDRMYNYHPDDYDSWDDRRKKRSKYLWNTDFHFGDWLIPSLVLGNPDGGAMMDTAYATMATVAPAYAAFSSQHIAQIAKILGKENDFKRYTNLYNKIKAAFIDEYVHDDGTMDADFQGIYVIALKNNLVSDSIRPLMVEHLCQLIEKNNGCLDTGFLSVPFLMEVLCENNQQALAYKLLFQTKCPSWLYMIEHGATTMWESWGAVGEDGTVSTYSYNHYAFGCIGEWMYNELGGLKIVEPGYKKFKIEPALDCGLTFVAMKKETPYGTIKIKWELLDNEVILHVTVPVNTTAIIILPNMEPKIIGSGKYTFSDCL